MCAKNIEKGITMTRNPLKKLVGRLGVEPRTY